MYTVKILPSEEFDKLPFKHAKEALGAADPSTNIAYVRDTGYNDVTKHTIEHELDELMQKTSPHEIDGIRYKIPVLGPIASGLGSIGSAVGSGIGSAASAIGSGIGNVAGAIGRGAGAIGSGLKGIVSGGGLDQAGRFGLLGDIGGGLKGLVAGPGKDQVGGFGRIGDLFGHGTRTGTAIPTPPGASTVTFPGVGQGPVPSPTTGSIMQAQQGGFLSNIFDVAKNIFAPQTGGQGTTLPGQTPPTFPVPTTEEDKSIMDRLFDAGIPLVTGLIGDALAPKPDDLDFSSVSGALRDRITGDALSPLFEAGQRELLQDLADPTQAPPEEAFARGDAIIQEDLEDQIENLRNQFKALNPNANVENNSAFLAEKSRLEERARERRAQVRDAASFQFVREQLQRDLQEIQTALNVDAAQTEQLIRIAQLDVAEIVNQYGLELQEAAEFKQLFGDFGQLLVQ